MAYKMQLSLLSWMFITTVALGLSIPVEERDAKEGDNITLSCRFAPHDEDATVTYYWLKTTPMQTHDNVAIGNLSLQSNYKVKYLPENGHYDLMISNATYERDNGRYECRVKAAGTGNIEHAQAFNLVVLIPPAAPVIIPGHHVHAQESHETNLTCLTSGGSPDPSIRWYREGSSVPSEANVTIGSLRNETSTAILTLSPTREDDETVFKCVVWNRAMPKDEQLEATVELSVNYYPRVEVGPDNPLRVELDSIATMECKVDAKPRVNSVRWTRNGKYISNSLVHTIHGVSVDDAGKYTCTADNGLGKTGEGDIFLDVLYPPTVTVESKTYETEEGGTVEIHCDISANPKPITIEWTMEGKPDFKQKGDTLLLTRVNADMAGTYTCKAVNVISTTNGQRSERSGSASVAVLVRHRPGRARISPERPVAQEGAGVTLTCLASPPGWPAPQYRWFRDTAPVDSKPAVLATGNKYTIPSAHLGSEGVYFCQATNELGHGDQATVTLEVHQPPRFQNKLQPHMTKRAGEREFSMTCSALGKPRPNIKWLKDNVEIKPDANLFEVKTDVTEARNAVFNVQSTLKFNGNARPDINQLLPEDRGVYSCTFENEVKKVESAMHLRIEHEPIAIKQKHKVAYDLSETAEISCRILAYPKPEFQWFYSTHQSPLEMSSDGHYEITTTSNNNDSYLTVLKVRNIKAQDYGNYYCKAQNTLGTIKPQIRLQSKGAPESPKSLKSTKVGASYVTLNWEAGFDGGLSNTKYFVSYKRLAGMNTASGGGQQCAAGRTMDSHWMEYDCGRANPCNVTRLNQHDTYLFKVKAVNTKGQSNHSNEITVTTKVDMIPAPEQITYDPSTKTVAFSVGPTCLALVGVAEALAGGRGQTPSWQVVDTLPMTLSGEQPTFQEAQIEYLQMANRRHSGREAAPAEEPNPRLRMKLCLTVSQEHCSEYTEAEIGPSYIKESSVLTLPRVVAIVMSILAFILFLTLFFIFCRCKKKAAVKENGKDYEMDSMRPSMVPQQNQAPPPYYPSSGMENKALEHSMDLALSMEDSKSAVYASQSGYGYHVAPHAQQHSAQNNDWGNMGYIENSYTNSNNAGSVNSQDSIWQMKMAAANGGVAPATGYGYDPVAHGGYGPADDYAPYPATDYGRASQNPSRQEYCADPYASVHKPKKRMDQHIESPYHEVSGLPESFGPPADDKPPHMSLSYDESLESGYSTPNSRARRVIREIIV